MIKAHLEDMSYIHSGLKITFKNEVTGETFDLAHPGGIPEFLARLVAEGQKPAVTETAVPSSSATTARRWKSPCSGPNRPTKSIRSYVNGIRTSAGGTHENGFKGGIVKAIRNYMETHEIKIKGLDITAEDIREGHRRHPVRLRARADVSGADQGAAQQSGDDGGRRVASSGRRWKPGSTAT